MSAFACPIGTATAGSHDHEMREPATHDPGVGESVDRAPVDSFRAPSQPGVPPSAQSHCGVQSACGPTLASAIASLGDFVAASDGPRRVLHSAAAAADLSQDPPPPSPSSLIASRRL